MTAKSNAGTVVVIHAEKMGHGDDALGEKLMGNYLRALAAVDTKPDAIVLYNAAVKLLAPSSPHLETLRALDAQGVDLLACVTCLEFYALTGQVAVGTVSNMREIVQLTMAASKVVTV